MTSEVCIAVISALDLDFLPGDFLDKLREQTQTSTESPSRTGNEDNYLTSDSVRINKKAKKKKVAKKKDKNKITQKMQKPAKQITTTPTPRVLRKPDIKKGQIRPLSRENVTEKSQSQISINRIYQPNPQSNSVLSSLVDQIPLSALTHLLPGISSLIESRNSVSSHNQGDNHRIVHVPADLHSSTPPNAVVQYKNRQTQLLPLSPSQFSRINRHPNRNAILKSLRDILGARPLSHMLQVPMTSSDSQPEARQKSIAQNLNVGQTNVIDVSIPFQRKGMGPLKFFN